MCHLFSVSVRAIQFRWLFAFVSIFIFITVVVVVVDFAANVFVVSSYLYTYISDFRWNARTFNERYFLLLFGCSPLNNKQLRGENKLQATCNNSSDNNTIYKHRQSRLTSLQNNEGKNTIYYIQYGRGLWNAYISFSSSTGFMNKR